MKNVGFCIIVLKFLQKCIKIVLTELMMFGWICICEIDVTELKRRGRKNENSFYSKSKGRARKNN